MLNSTWFKEIYVVDIWNLSYKKITRESPNFISSLNFHLTLSSDVLSTVVYPDFTFDVCRFFLLAYSLQLICIWRRYLFTKNSNKCGQSSSLQKISLSTVCIFQPMIHRSSLYSGFLFWLAFSREFLSLNWFLSSQLQ